MSYLGLTETEPPSLIDNSLMDTDEGLERTQSLHDLYTESPKGHQRTASQLNMHKCTRNKYDFVESKVKQYRLHIQNQERENKKRMLLEKLENRKFNHSTSEINDNDIIDEKDKLLIEKQKIIDVLNGQLVEQIRLNSSNQIKIESMRMEISCLKSRIEINNSTNSGTPTSVRAPHFHIFKTPIRTISRTLLSPFRKNESKNNVTVESFSDDDSFDNNSNDSSTVVEVPPSETFTIAKDPHKCSYTSQDVLMEEEKPRRKFSKNVMNLMFGCMTCKRNTNPSQHTNKIYPSVEKGQIVLSEIPLILLTPSK